MATPKTSPYFRVEPESQITFNYLPRKYLNSNIRITNTSDQPLAYKVKTNVPTCYLVKPHVGILPSRHSVDVNITMQPTDYNPQNASINDKFQINVVPLPIDTDIAALSDQTRFQQAWDSVPKQQVQLAKLKVVLKFDAAPRLTASVPDKPEKITDDGNKQPITEPKKPEPSSATVTGAKTSDVLRTSQESSRDDLKNSSMMMSFGNSASMNSAINRSTSQGQALWAGPGSEQSLGNSQTITVNRVQNEEREKEKGVVVDREVREEKGRDARDALKPLEEKIEQLGRRIDELMGEKKMLSQKHQELTGKAEEQKRMLFELSEENGRLKSELGNLKSSTFMERSQKKGQMDAGTYQLWHVLVASLIAMVIGAYLSSS